MRDLLRARRTASTVSAESEKHIAAAQGESRARRVMLVLAVFAAGLALRLPTFFRPLLSDDEAIYATTANALARGELLYRDVVDHKPPLIYHVYQAGFAALGSYDTAGAHALVVLAVLLTAALLYALMRPEGVSQKTPITSRSEPGTADFPSPQRGRGVGVRANSFPSPCPLPEGEGDSARPSFSGASSRALRSTSGTFQTRGEGERAGLAVAALFLIFSTTWHDYDALAANCELFVLAPQALAALLLIRDAGRPRAGAPGAHFAVGCLVGISALFKYQGLTFLGVSAGILAWSVLLGRMRWSRAVALAACQVIAAILPAAAYLAWCARAGNAEAAVYWFRFNFSYVGAGLTGTVAFAQGLRRTLMIGGSALVPYGFGLVAATSVVRAVARTVRLRIARASLQEESTPAVASVVALLWLATSAIAVCAGGRFFGHYFHLLLPALCLLAAPGVARLWSRDRRRRLALLFLCAVPALLFFALASFARPLAASLDERDPSYDGVAARIAALTSPDERIFVWGNSPQLYVLARRPMGTRFSFCNYMTGESPGTPTENGQWNADRNQLPVAWDMLFADLDSRRPALLVDAAAAGWDGYDKFPIARYPRLAAYVDAHYRRLESKDGVVLYRRVQ